MKFPRVAYALLLLVCLAREANAQAAQAALNTASKITSHAACKTYHATGDVPATASTGPIMSIIDVPDAFELTSVVVKDLTLNAGKLAGIKVSLSAAVPKVGTPTTVVLKDVQPGAAASAATTTSWQTAAFDDDAAKPFPEAAAAPPITGAFIPKQMLLGFTTGDNVTAGAGGSKGSWLLRVIDLNHTPQPITLKSWSLELCPLPVVKATDGDEDDIAAVANATLRASNTTDKNSTEHTGGLLSDLLERINTAAQRNPLLANRTTGLRAFLNGNETLVDRVYSRIETMLTPYIETRIVKALEQRNTGNTTRVSRIWATNGTLFRSSSDGNDTDNDTLFEKAVAGFLGSFEDLMKLAGISNLTSSAKDLPTLRSAMQQSGIGLWDNDSAMSLRNILQGIGSGSLLPRFTMGNRIMSAANDAMAYVSNKLTSGPIASAVNAKMSAAFTSATNQYRDALSTLTQAAGVQRDYSKATHQETLNFLGSSKGLLSKHLQKQIDNYRDFVNACSALVQGIIKQQSEKAAEATSTMVAGIRSSLENLNKMSGGAGHGRLKELLTQQLSNLQALDKHTSELMTGDAAKVVSSMMEAYKTSVDALKTTAATTLTAKKSQVQQQAEQAQEALAAIMAKVGQGPIAQRYLTAMSQVTKNMPMLGNMMPKLMKFDESPPMSTTPFRDLLSGKITLSDAFRSIGNGPLMSRWQSAAGSGVNPVDALKLQQGWQELSKKLQQSVGH